MPNEEKSYAIVDKENHIIEYFRGKKSAMDMLSYFQEYYFDNLEIITIK